VRQVPREDWDSHTVGEMMGAARPRTRSPRMRTPLTRFNRMNRTGASRLMVVEGDRLVGIVRCAT